MPLVTENRQYPKTPTAIFYSAVVIVGIGSGFFGMLLALLLHTIQHLAYGYSLNHVISDENFLEGVSASSPLRRISVLMGCGFIAGLGWYTLYRFGKPLVSIAEAVKSNKAMPFGETILHALLQIVTIALGSPLGREVAPREIGAIFAYWFSSNLRLNTEETRLLLACGAGAGLAAVYNVPLGGALFVVEVLLSSYQWSVVIPALITSILAVLVSWIGLDNKPLYQVHDLIMSYPLIIWSILFGPVFGYIAHGFINIANTARSKAPRTWVMPVICVVNFTLIGLLAIDFPSLLGNGKSPAQIEFNNALSIELSLALLILRMLICWSSLGVGAQGGLLTPSLANGALLGVVFGGLWSYVFPGSSWDTYAIVGAVSFLAAAQKMPLTAIVLLFEFTHMNVKFILPMALAVSGATLTSRWCQRH